MANKCLRTLEHVQRSLSMALVFLIPVCRNGNVARQTSITPWRSTRVTFSFLLHRCATGASSRFIPLLRECLLPKCNFPGSRRSLSPPPKIDVASGGCKTSVTRHSDSQAIKSREGINWRAA